MRHLPMVLLFAAAAAFAQGTRPRDKAELYPLHAPAGEATLAAEYMVHSISREGQTVIAPSYLVVEVAIFPRPDSPLDVNAGHFTLRINGRKSVLLPQAPAMVGASIKYADWERRPGFEASGGAGGVGVILGRPRSTERFPGDRRPTEDRLPQPPRAPEPEDRSGQAPRAPVEPGELVQAAALPEGPARGPVAGYLYFAWKGKLSSIKSLDLLYRDVVLRLN